MPKHCVAFGCTNHNLKLGKNISYHVFPRDADGKQRWVQAVKRQNIDGSNCEPSKHP